MSILQESPNTFKYQFFYMNQGNFFWAPSISYPLLPYFTPSHFLYEGQSQNYFNFPHQTHFNFRNSVENYSIRDHQVKAAQRNTLLTMQKQERKQPTGIKKQKQDRNSYSNSLKLFMKYLRDLKKSDHRVLRTAIDKIQQRGGISYSVEQFFEELCRVLPSRKSYIGMTQIQILTNGGGASDKFVKIFRILFRHFYKEELYKSVITSKKITGKAKEKQIEEARTVYKKLLDQK